MDASEIMEERKHRVLCWLLQGTEPGLLRSEFDVTTTMGPIIAVLDVIPVCYLPIRAENAVKFELQS